MMFEKILDKIFFVNYFFIYPFSNFKNNHKITKFFIILIFIFK
jgi:hypothetical protein